MLTYAAACCQQTGLETASHDNIKQQEEDKDLAQLEDALAGCSMRTRIWKYEDTYIQQYEDTYMTV
jgi:hypothetical protein